MMELYTQKSVEELKKKIKIVEVVSEFVKVVRHSHFATCLCPFHEGISHSMIITEKNNMYYCFTCEAKGDAIMFLMTHRKMSFEEALIYLSIKYKVRLERCTINEDDKGSIRKSKKKSINKLLQMLGTYS